ncbi:MAG: Tn3 family transposase [Clostridiaceae bacterium]
MPVEFLTKDQELLYGKFIENPSFEQLTKYFWLDDEDLRIIFQHRNDYNRLGFAIQLGTVRFLGTFLSNPIDIPKNVIIYVSQQLKIDEETFLMYTSSKNIQNHRKEICMLYGYRDFTKEPYHWRLVRWLYTRSWITPERPSILFDLATARCIEQKILLPGVTVMARLIAQVRDRSTIRLWKELLKLPNENQVKILEGLLVVDEKDKKSKLDVLRQPPTTVSVTGTIKAIERFEEIHSLGAGNWNSSKIPMGRIIMLARYAATAKIQTIARMNYERRIATLVAFAVIFNISAQDDMIDVVEQFLTELFKRSNRKEQKTRLRTIKDLDLSARKLKEVCSLLLDENISDVDMRLVIFSIISKEDLNRAVHTVDKLTNPPEQTVAFDELFSSYGVVRRFLPKFLLATEFKSTSAAQSVLNAWNFLKNNENRKGKSKYANATLDGISELWKKTIIKSKNKISSCGYTFWVIAQLLEALKNHDIYVENSDRYGDTRAKLLQGKAWEIQRPHILRTLDWKVSAEESLKPLSEELDKAYKETAERWNINPNVKIETFDGKDRLILSPLDKLEESKSLKQLRKKVQSLIPNTDLPELILEVISWTGMTEAFTHISEGNSRVEDLDVSICAVLIVQACNIGIETVVQKGTPALEYDRLKWVEQNYLRVETLTKANAKLVGYNSNLKLAQTWGGGEVASADGLRFVTPVKTTTSRANSKYFGRGRGVTYYNFVSDQFTGFHGIVIPGTLRDSMYLIEGILEQQTTLKPKEIMTDTAGYSDIVFGLFGLLGYQFSPRIADIGKTTFWRLDTTADYGVLNKLAKGKIHKDLIGRYWDDMLRIAGSLKMGVVSPTELIQTLQRNGKPTMLGKSLGEFGRIYKTQYLLTYVDDKGYRRKILTQLNRGESRHNLARAVFYGKKGELHQAYREGQEDQLGALGLVVNAIIVWNTRYMELAIENLRKSYECVYIDDIKRLSPLGYEHINIMGKYSFKVSEEIRKGMLRSLLTLETEIE